MDLQKLGECVITGDAKTAIELTTAGIEEGMAPDTILNDGLIPGMTVVGVRFKAMEMFIPEVLLSARAMKASLALLEPLLIECGIKPIGIVMLGTVRGDLHDIGKNLVGMMLQGAGFEIIDLGVDVSTEKFVEEAQKHNPDVIGFSALLTTTMVMMERNIKALRKAGITAPILIGGAPISQVYADQIGADGYGKDGVQAVEITKEVLEAESD